MELCVSWASVLPLGLSQPFYLFTFGFDIASHCAAMAGPELAMLSMLGSNLKLACYLCLRSAGLKLCAAERRGLVLFLHGSHYIAKAVLELTLYPWQALNPICP